MISASSFESQWVKKKDFVDGVGNPWGFTDGQIRGKINRGVWTAGLEYGVFDGETYINPEAIEQWFGQQAVDQRETALSRSGGEPSRTDGPRTSNSHTQRRASVRLLE